MFRRISRQLDVVSAKLSVLLVEVKAPHAVGNTVYLSTALGTTLNALRTLAKPASAHDISAITHRSRALEGSHLNELFRQGMVTKGNRGKRKVFALKEEYHDKR